jgi:hypothetical protein
MSSFISVIAWPIQALLSYVFHLRTERMKEEDLMYSEIRKLTNDLIIEFGSCVKSSFLNRESMGDDPNNSIGFYLLDKNEPEKTKLKIQTIFFENNKFNRYWEKRKQRKIFGYFMEIFDKIEFTRNVVSNSIDIPEDDFQKLWKLSGKIQ